MNYRNLRFAAPETADDMIKGTQRAHKVTAWIILMLFLHVGTGIARAAVLCFDADGGFSMEVSCSESSNHSSHDGEALCEEGCCDESTDYSSTFSLSEAAFSGYGDNGLCGPCVDIPVFKDSLGDRIISNPHNPHENIVAISASTLFAYPIFTQTPSENFRYFKQPHGRDSTLQSLKTVIILS